MSAARFIVVKQTQVSKDNREAFERVLEIVCTGRPGETADDLAIRYMQQKYPAPAPVEKPVAPPIKPNFPLDAPRPKYDQATVDAAAKLEARS